MSISRFYENTMMVKKCKMTDLCTYFRFNASVHSLAVVQEEDPFLGQIYKRSVAVFLRLRVAADDSDTADASDLSLDINTNRKKNPTASSRRSTTTHTSSSSKTGSSDKSKKKSSTTPKQSLKNDSSKKDVQKDSPKKESSKSPVTSSSKPSLQTNAINKQSPKTDQGQEVLSEAASKSPVGGSKEAASKSPVGGSKEAGKAQAISPCQPISVKPVPATSSHSPTDTEKVISQDKSSTEHKDLGSSTSDNQSKNSGKFSNSKKSLQKKNARKSIPSVIPLTASTLTTTSSTLTTTSSTLTTTSSTSTTVSSTPSTSTPPLLQLEKKSLSKSDKLESTQHFTVSDGASNKSVPACSLPSGKATSTHTSSQSDTSVLEIQLSEFSNRGQTTVSQTSTLDSEFKLVSNKNLSIAKSQPEERTPPPKENLVDLSKTLPKASDNLYTSSTTQQSIRNSSENRSTESPKQKIVTSDEIESKILPFIPTDSFSPLVNIQPAELSNTSSFSNTSHNLSSSEPSQNKPAEREEIPFEVVLVSNSISSLHAEASQPDLQLSGNAFTTRSESLKTLRPTLDPTSYTCTFQPNKELTSTSIVVSNNDSLPVTTLSSASLSTLPSTIISTGSPSVSTSLKTLPPTSHAFNINDLQEVVETEVSSVSCTVDQRSTDLPIEEGFQGTTTTSSTTSQDETYKDCNSIFNDLDIAEVPAEQAAKMTGDAVPQQVRVLTLETRQNLDTKLFRLQKGWTVQFRRGATLFGKSVSLFINCPASASEPFERSRYRELPWHSDSGSQADDTALYAQVTLTAAGSFRYYFVISGSSQHEGSGYLLVDPTMTIGANNDPLPLDCIQCQTVMAKNLGPFSQWRDRLRVSKETGYNMIHFTPIQALGRSNSAYSLADQHALNLTFHEPGKQCTLDDMHALMHEMKTQWNVLALTDIVLNHTANESPWLQQHPEATFNMDNSPHLRPAYLVDRALYYCSVDVAEGKLAEWGMPSEITCDEQLAALASHIFNLVLLPLHLEEFYTLDVDAVVAEFKKRIECQPPSTEPREVLKLEFLPDSQYRRKKSTVDLVVAVKLFNLPHACDSEEERVQRCCAELRGALDALNKEQTEAVTRHLHAATDGTMGTIRYERVQINGPRINKVSARHPLVPPYFTHYGPDTDIASDELLMYSPEGRFLMAHNGWVMNHDPLKNFAEPGSLVYLRRELVAWGDSVKLRYGARPSDSPYLWDHMKRYCEYTAKVFGGIRLDNCHSTPIHVAEYLLDAARRVRSDLYVIAELFTNSDDTDNVFVNRLGINSLIREAMSAPNSHEEGRLVFRYGGEPVGAFLLPPVRPLVPSVAHAIFLDLTHDNKSPVEVRTAYDMLPSSALVSMACCASGSNRGYDELVPHHIHVVNEKRLYTSWSEEPSSPGLVGPNTGIISAKKLFNDLHFTLGRDGFSQVFVDQVSEHVVTVTRHNPVSHQSVVLVAYTSFRPPGSIPQCPLRPLRVQGTLDEILFELEQRPSQPGDEHKASPGSFTRDPDFITGLSGIEVAVRESVPLDTARLVRRVDTGEQDMLELHYTEHFRPGAVVAFRISLMPKAQAAVNSVRKTLAQFSYKPRLNEVTVLDESLQAALASIDLVSLNRCLYRCEQEEQDDGRGRGVYNVPEWRPFVYCGLQGMESVLSTIRVHNDLGHPVCRNLRDGDWMLDYTSGRLKAAPSTASLGLWLEAVLSEVKQVPRYLIPAYFDAVVSKLYLALINRTWQSMAQFIKSGSVFARQLGLCSVQFCAVVPSAPLPRLSPNLKSPQPAQDPDTDAQRAVSIAAGLPHFCHGYMRNWGRDTFIALPGNLLIPGRYEEARWVILAFAGTMRHGLIPNLLDGGPKARFNCRDAVWFWLMAIQRYVEQAPNGHHIMRDQVSRLFPRDDSEAQLAGASDQSLEFVIQEALTRHFQGQSFRERNAGHSIDEQMTDQGFNNQIGVDLDTGFPFGGNVHNCGTWMDKMGSSEKAGNKGRPATPRDGSAVEIVGLCKASVTFLAALYKAKKFSYQGVTRVDEKGNELNWTYSFWAQHILSNFSKLFYISTEPEAPEKRPDLVNRRGIYKDSVGATNDWPDYQLRCNFPIALAVAPELVDPQQGLAALEVAERALLGPLGIKTLDPTDWNYRPNYNNGDDSTDASVARGFNYHQGPEWVWPVGFLLRAQLALSRRLGDPDQLRKAVSRIKARLSQHFTHLLSHEWRSLPELTNGGGSVCNDSNPAQSWSTGCLLEVLWELEKLELQSR